MPPPRRQIPRYHTSKASSRSMTSTTQTLAVPPVRYSAPPVPRAQPASTASDYKQRIHVLGTGSVGKFLAHAVRSAPESPPISLLFHRPAFIATLQKSQCDLTVISDKVPTRTGPFDVELVLPERLPLPENSVRTPAHLDRNRIERQHSRFISEAPIRQLIVTVKAHQTVAALRPLRYRLSAKSTILFCQNGMGTVDEVCDELWPEEEGRPTMMLGVNSHGVHATGAFTAVHAGHGVMFLGVLPPSGSVASDRLPSHTTSLHQQPHVDEHALASSTALSMNNNSQTANFSTSARALLRTLTRIPLLAATPIPPNTLHQRALEKLAVNAVINPLTVLLDARNGALLHNHALSRCFRLLLLEISAVFRALPELKGVPSLDIKFSPERLENMIVSVAGRTADNISSMLQDVRRGSKTEIEYFNGYVVRRGEEVGVRPVMNYLMLNMVKGKQQVVSKEVDAYAPFGGKL